jgi:hypothetical protein
MKNCGNIAGWQLFLLLLITSLMTTGVEVEVLAAEATGAVDLSTVYQELEGFGAAGGRYENWLPAHPKKSNLYNILFGQNVVKEGENVR